MIGSKGLPDKLTREEEIELFKRMENHDDLARQTIIEHNMRLVVHIAKKFSNKAFNDDFISVGTIGLIKAVDAFDYKTGNKFSRFAGICIENEIKMFLRIIKRDNNVVSLEKVIAKDKNDENLTIGDTIVYTNDEQANDDVDNMLLRDKIVKLAKTCLTPLQFKVVCMRYGLVNGNRMTQQCVANELNVTRSYIARIEMMSKKILKDNLPYILTADEIDGFKLVF